MKKVLVTGADGFIGSHLTEMLVKKGYYVKALNQYNSFNNWGWLDTLSKKQLDKISIFSGDIKQQNDVLRSMQSCDSVIHLASLIAIPYSYKSPKSYIDTNVIGTLNILEASKQLKIKKIIHTSTSEVYGTAKYVPIDENHPIQTQSPYAASKSAADQLAYSFYKSFNLPIVTLRPFNTYGPRQSARAVIPSMIVQILNGKKKINVGSLTPITANLYLGGTSVVMREFDPVRAWQLFEEEKITSGLLVPAMLNFMIQVENKNEFDRSKLRWIQSGASPLPVSLIEKYLEMNIDIHQVYGLTETCGPACLITGQDAIEKIGSTGKAFFHTEVRVVSEDGDDVGPGSQGEVWVKGKHIMREYWNRPDASAETITQDGWLRTGDIAAVDAEGFVYIQDRIKDMIISGGENVYPAEIENLILSHPQVVEVAVIGQPSVRWGESPFAVVVKNDETLSEDNVLSFCDEKLARFKLPKGVAFIDVIPRNANGKVLKRLLREQFPGPAAK